MVLEQISQFMSADHRRCDARFATAEEAVSNKDWGAARPLFDSCVQAMARHFGMEEEILFPEFEHTTGNTAGPAQVMRMEHAQIHQLISQCDDALSEQDGEAFLGASETLLAMIQQHNMKEEQILYQLTDQVLGGGHVLGLLKDQASHGG